MDPRVRVGGESGAVLAGRGYDLDRTAVQHGIELQHVVAGNAKDVADAVVLQTTDQVVAN